MADGPAAQVAARWYTVGLVLKTFALARGWLGRPGAEDVRTGTRLAWPYKKTMARNCCENVSKYYIFLLLENYKITAQKGTKSGGSIYPPAMI